MIEKIINFIEKSFDFIQSKILIIMQYILQIMQNNVSGFFQFLFEKNIILTAIGVVVSTQISRLMTAFMTIFVDPIIKRMSAGTVANLKDLEVEVYDTNFKIGLFIETLFNGGITFYVVYQLYTLSKNKDMAGITNWLRNAKNQVKEIAQDKTNVVISVKS
jgi:large-conductance mechanosensitive channel